MVAFLLAGGACTDDVPGLTTTSDTDDFDTTTTGGPMVTTIDPDTSGGMTTGTDTGETSRGETETSTTDAPTTDAPTTTDGGAVCGNGMVEDGEQCDVEDLGGETCESQGFGGGALGCADDCTFDTSRCAAGKACGNDVLEGAEQCDGTDLGGEDCASQGFDGGTLGCADDCTLDTSACTVAPACGNGAVDPGEACDGADLAGEDCVTQGFVGGVLACAGDCTAFDTAGCMGGGGDCCAEQMGTGCSDPGCEAAICGADPFCCATQWDEICANAALDNAACLGIGGSCPAPGVCGNDLVDGLETCDGADLGGEDCVSQGFAGGGVLACLGDCSGYDIAGCIGADLPCADQDVDGNTGPAVATGSTVGSDDDIAPSCGGTDGNDEVIEFTATVAGSHTFDTFGSSYDTKLALYSDCATQISCNDDFIGTQSLLVLDMMAGQTIAIVVDGYNGAVGDYVLNITPPPVCGDGVVEAPESCDGANLDGQTCATQGFAGGVLACAAGCNAFDTAGCMGVPAFPCEDENIGSVIGANVATGTTAMGQDNDLDPACGAGDANDRVIRFQAPAAAQYTFNTNGSSYDTVLAVFSDCTTQLQCDDDNGAGTQSLLSRNLAAGETVLILIDGYNGATGNYILNITSP